jgi:hypothetical protein
MNSIKRKFVQEENKMFSIHYLQTNFNTNFNTNLDSYPNKRNKLFCTSNYENFVELEKAQSNFEYIIQNDLELENIGKSMSRNKKL